MSNSLTTNEIRAWMIAKYPKLGKTAADEFDRWRGGQVPYAYPEMLDRHLELALEELRGQSQCQKYLKLIFDAFYQVLPFGTGGRRGPVGYGSNRLNRTTVAMTIQGHCNYLRRTFPNRKDLAVVVANDVRVFNDIAGNYQFLGESHPLLGVSSRTLGMLACSIYAANGITAYFARPASPDAVLTTPELSFVIKQLKAVGGINVSASHNPPDDNGVKVYDEYGSQPVAPNDQTLVEAMTNVVVKELPYEEAVGQGLVRDIPGELHEQYHAAYLKKFSHLPVPDPGIAVVYTPLCGCGLTTVGEALTKAGFPWRMPPNQGPDGTFKEIPFRAPNPEVPEATVPAKDFADEIGAGVVLSSDPDADRVGLEAKLADGTWYHFDGNQIGAILGYYLMLDPKGPRQKGLVIETLVTTRILGKIVKKRGEGSQIIDDLLVGFKYVADVLKSLEQSGHFHTIDGDIRCRPDDLVLAAEESHGVIVLPTIRDKDATPACVFLAALYQRLKKEGRTLLDYYHDILDAVGGYDSVVRSIVMYGADGVSQRDRIMESIRANPPKEIDGLPVKPEIKDFWDERKFGAFKSESDKLPRNVYQIATESFTVTVRPSGTEPKIKLYCQVLPDQKSAQLSGAELARKQRESAERVTCVVYGDLLERAGLPRLDHAALLLPDIVSFERKLAFQETTVPQLREGLLAKRWSSLADLKSWLLEETKPMTPGADPLPALRSSIARLCTEWAELLRGNPVGLELQKWASG